MKHIKDSVNMVLSKQIYKDQQMAQKTLNRFFSTSGEPVLRTDYLAIAMGFITLWHKCVNGVYSNFPAH